VVVDSGDVVHIVFHHAKHHSCSICVLKKTWLFDRSSRVCIEAGRRSCKSFFCIISLLGRRRRNWVAHREEHGVTCRRDKAEQRINLQLFAAFPPFLSLCSTLFTKCRRLFELCYNLKTFSSVECQSQQMNFMISDVSGAIVWF